MSSTDNNTKQLNSNLPPPQRPTNTKPKPHSFKPYKNGYNSKHTNSESTTTDNTQSLPSTHRIRTVSIEEPVPVPESSNHLHIQVVENNKNNIPIGLPYIPSPFHSSINNNYNQLRIVSEIHADEISNKMTLLSPILIESSSNTPQISPSYNSSSASSNISLVSSAYASVTINNMNNNQMMMQSSANCGDVLSQNNNSNNTNTNDNDKKNNDQNDNSGCSGGAGGAGGAGSGGSSGGGRKPGKDDDDKKKENVPDIDDDEDDEDDDDDDELEEKKVVSFSTWNELNTEADEFVPRSRSASSLCCINEHCVLGDVSKSLPTQRKSHCSYVGTFRYNPIGLDRAQGCIKISKELTQIIIPSMIVENIESMYDFLDKSTAIAIYDGCYYDNGQFRIFNYGFHNKSGEMLYCVVDKIGNHRYIMRHQLFTKKEICSVCSLNENDLAKPVVDLHPDPICITYMEKIKTILNNPAEFCENIVLTTKWHKQYIFNTKNNKGFNTQRHTFSITKTEFIAIIIKEIYKNDKTLQLIPIIMFNILSNGYRLEYIHIVQLKENISIGIAYIYDDKYGVKVSGIHLNKNNILNQHQLVSLHHDCHCLDSFESELNDLHIGNPDDEKNKYKDLKKKSNALKDEIVQLKQEKDQEKVANQQLQAEIGRLKQQHKVDVVDVDRLRNTVNVLQKQVLQKHDIIEYYRRLNHSINSSVTMTTPSTNTNRSYSYSFSATPNTCTPQSIRLRGMSNVSNVSSSSFSGLVNNLCNTSNNHNMSAHSNNFNGFTSLSNNMNNNTQQ